MTATATAQAARVAPASARAMRVRPAIRPPKGHEAGSSEP